jgi:hypothetical protein
MLQPLTEGKAVVQLVLPLSWVARINRLAIERGVNRSALIRQALAATYGVDVPEAATPGQPAAVVTSASEVTAGS